MTIKVLIVDDSAVVRQVLQQQLAKHRDIEIIGAAADPIFAMEKMKTLWPDVIVLDVEMPRMDGVTFLRQIMSTRPTPVVICSTLTEAGAEITMKALAAGAFAIVTKPRTGLRDFIVDSSDDLLSVIREASGARMDRMRARTEAAAPTQKKAELSPRPKLTADEILAAPSDHMNVPLTEKIVAIGCSTGGTQALEVVLTALPRTAPGIVVVQHMPAQFTKSFAMRLHTMSEVEVREAETGDRVLPGRVLIAPGGRHLVVKRSGAQYYVEVIDGPLVSRHRPSVDVLFRSVAKAAGQNAIGFIMTGMGDDGARGLKEMRETGAMTYGQDEATCVVFGMPKEAIKLGAVTEEIALDEIPKRIAAISRKQWG